MQAAHVMSVLTIAVVVWQGNVELSYIGVTNSHMHNLTDYLRNGKTMYVQNTNPDPGNTGGGISLVFHNSSVPSPNMAMFQLAGGTGTTKPRS